MSYLFVILLLVMIGPLLVGDWRASLFGLALQGILLAAIAWRTTHSLAPSECIVLVDFVLIRGIGAPLMLGRVMAARKIARRSDIIPVNLLSWALAAGLILASFRVANQLVPHDEVARTRVAVAGAGVLLAMLILATQNSIFSQIVGAIRLENAIALLESGSTHPPSLVVQVALTGVFVLTIVAFTVFLRRMDLAETTGPIEPAPEAPSL